MPIFEYHCESCRHQFERLLRAATREEQCPRCGAIARRCVSAAAAPPSSSGCAPRGEFT